MAELTAPGEGTPDLRRGFSLAFQVPGYRWLWLYSLFSAAAFTGEVLSQGWLVLQLTNSPFYVGMTAGARGAAQALFSLAGGPVVDRADRRRLLVAAQLAGAIGALTFAVLLLAHAVRLWQVFLYVVLSGAVAAISRPTAGGLVYDLVGPHRLLNANAFQFMAGSFVRIAGALAGGVIIDRLGVGHNYLLISTAYVGGAGALCLLRKPPASTGILGPLMRSVTTRLGHALHRREIRMLLVLSMIVEIFGYGYQAMMPVMARDVLRVGPIGLGSLLAMVGLGQLVATVLMAARGDWRNKGTVLVAAAVGFGGFIALFGLSPWFLASMILVAIVGAAGSIYDTSMSTVLMTAATDQNRGSVLGLYNSTIGLGAIGSLAIGGAAILVGGPMALAVCGSAVMLGAMCMRSRLDALNRIERPAPGGTTPASAGAEALDH